MIGNALTDADITGYAPVATFDNADIAMFCPSPNEIKTFRFDGTDWAELGTGTEIRQTGNKDPICTIGKNILCRMDINNSDLKTYKRIINF